jgi:hypothetical protein
MYSDTSSYDGGALFDKFKSKVSTLGKKKSTISAPFQCADTFNFPPTKTTDFTKQLANCAKVVQTNELKGIAPMDKNTLSSCWTNPDVRQYYPERCAVQLKHESQLRKNAELPANLAKCSDSKYYAHYQKECDNIIAKHYDEINKIEAQRRKASDKEKLRGQRVFAATQDPRYGKEEKDKKRSSKFMQGDLETACLGVVIDSFYRDLNNGSFDQENDLRNLYKKINSKTFTLREYLKIIYWFESEINKKNTGTEFSQLTPLAAPSDIIKKVTPKKSVEKIMLAPGEHSGSLIKNMSGQNRETALNDTCGNTHRDRILDGVHVENPRIKSMITSLALQYHIF